MTTSVTAALAGFTASVRYEDLPPEVVRQAGLCLLDAIGCAAGAYEVDPHKAALAGAMIARTGVSGTAAVIGDGAASPSAAALANGILIGAVFHDDVHGRARMHLGSVVVPAALAATQACGGTGRDLAVAMVSGYEVGARVGLAVVPSHSQFWHPTATNGTFGAAAAAASAWGLDADACRAVLGLAGTQAGGLNTFLETGDDSKAVHSGKAAMNGVLAAELVQLGASGPPDVLGQPNGYLAAYCADPNPEALTADLGDTWEILQVGFKLYPSIRPSHAPIGATIDALRENGIDPRRISSITVHTYPAVPSHFSSKEIDSSMEARRSLPYCVAAAAVDGEVTARQFSAHRYQDETIRTLLDRVEIVEAAEFAQSGAFPARVVVETEDGDRHEVVHDYPAGDPRNPVTVDQLVQKFRDNLCGTALQDRTDQLIGLCTEIEHLDMTALRRCLTTA